ncbi:MAG: cupin domain-containing protein [Dehalococcoidales bacterium]|nr:cupin domain-containing protein [Dehalococcoidales bacterium]
MTEKKWEKYILTEPPKMEPKSSPDGPKMLPLLMQNGANLDGAFHVNCMWVTPGPNPGIFEAHSHPYDEMIGFVGTNPEDPYDLGAEATLWIEDEKYVITRSFLAFFPKGVVHCPLTVSNVRRPILLFDIQLCRKRPEFIWAKDSPPARR